MKTSKTWYLRTAEGDTVGPITFEAEMSADCVKERAKEQYNLKRLVHWEFWTAEEHEELF